MVNNNKPGQKKFDLLLENISKSTSRVTGSSIGFSVALLIIILWACTGPIFNFSDTWQLVINTGTTIITFLMVFLIQRTQNKDSEAIQLKLNELIIALKGASNRMAAIENIPETELRELKDKYDEISKKVENEDDVTKSHTVEETMGKSESITKKTEKNKSPDKTKKSEKSKEKNNEK